MEETKGPGIGLAVVGGLGLLGALLNIVFGGLQMTSEHTFANGIGGVIGGCLGLVFGGFIIFGGIKLMKGESYGLCMAAAIFAMLPFCTGACCLFGLPIGIWAIVSMNKVKDQFR